MKRAVQLSVAFTMEVEDGLDGQMDARAKVLMPLVSMLGKLECYDPSAEDYTATGFPHHIHLSMSDWDGASRPVATSAGFEKAPWPGDARQVASYTTEEGSTS